MNLVSDTKLYLSTVDVSHPLSIYTCMGLMDKLRHAKNLIESFGLEGGSEVVLEINALVDELDKLEFVPTTPHSNWSDMSIDGLDLDTRCRTCLSKEGLHTVGELVAYISAYDYISLMKIPDLGRKSYERIISSLKNYLDDCNIVVPEVTVAYKGIYTYKKYTGGCNAKK